MKSTNVFSSIRSDLGKIIYLIQDGVSVKTNDKLIAMDPAPFEEFIEDLKRKTTEQYLKIEVLERALQWETNQVDHEEKAAKIEIESSELEMNKIIHGDGPSEDAKLKTTMQKAYAVYEESINYTTDLMELESNGFLNPIELKQARKKLNEEEETYHFQKMQYENFIKHTHPMQIKKALTSIKRNKNKYEEILKSGAFKIAKAHAQNQQSKQELYDLQHQLKNTEEQMKLTQVQ